LEIKSLICLILFSLLPLSGCRKDDAKADAPAEASADKKPVEVFAEAVHPTDIFEPIIFAGYLESEHRYAVTAESTGVLEAVKVTAGDRVQKGAALAVIKPVSQGLTYQSQVITSPLAGIVTEISATPGFPVNAGHTLMMVEKQDAVILNVSIPAQDLQNAKTAKVVDVTVFGKHTTGTIASINSRADKITGTFPARVKLECGKDCADFPPGSLARATIRSKERKGFKIPLGWLQQGRKKVLVVDTESKARWVPVKLGSYLGEFVEVTEGITDGMRIVSGFSERPEEGAVVVVTARETPAVSQKDGAASKG
jgi:multidrug efflux pump subunit AcrA (membrane-fusion protein)